MNIELAGAQNFENFCILCNGQSRNESANAQQDQQIADKNQFNVHTAIASFFRLCNAAGCHCQYAIATHIEKTAVVQDREKKTIW